MTSDSLPQQGSPAASPCLAVHCPRHVRRYPSAAATAATGNSSPPACQGKQQRRRVAAHCGWQPLQPFRQHDGRHLHGLFAAGGERYHLRPLTAPRQVPLQRQLLQGSIDRISRQLAAVRPSPAIRANGSWPPEFPAGWHGAMCGKGPAAGFHPIGAVSPASPA